MTQSYQRRCRKCTEMIHMLKCNDHKWKPFDFPDRTSSGKWELHKCSGRWE